MPILTPLILTGPDKFPGVNIRCSSKTPEFGNSYLSLNVEISPFSITNTEFLIVFFSVLFYFVKFLLVYFFSILLAFYLWS